jgi:hypothetical protein
VGQREEWEIERFWVEEIKKKKRVFGGQREREKRQRCPTSHMSGLKCICWNTVWPKNFFCPWNKKIQGSHRFFTKLTYAIYL